MRGLLLLLLLALAAPAAAQTPSLVVEYDRYGGPGRATTVRVLSDGTIERSESGLPAVASAPVRTQLRAADLAAVRAAVTRARAVRLPAPRSDGSQMETFKFDGGTQVWFGAHPPAAIATLVRQLMRLAPAARRPDPHAPPVEPAFS